MTTDATPQTSAPWLTGPQMAGHLQISLRHLIRLRELGLPHVRLGTAIRYKAAEVEHYLHDHRRLPSYGVRHDSYGLLHEEGVPATAQGADESINHDREEAAHE